MLRIKQSKLTISTNKCQNCNTLVYKEYFCTISLSLSLSLSGISQGLRLILQIHVYIEKGRELVFLCLTLSCLFRCIFLHSQGNDHIYLLVVYTHFLLPLHIIISLSLFLYRASISYGGPPPIRSPLHPYFDQQTQSLFLSAYNFKQTPQTINIIITITTP